MSENRTSIPRAAATSTVFLLNSSDLFSRTVPAAVAEASQFLDRRLIALKLELADQCNDRVGRGGGRRLCRGPGVGEGNGQDQRNK
jgi:hypothetical protein